MQEVNYDENSIVLNHKDEVISFKCELQENLQKDYERICIYKLEQCNECRSKSIA